MKNGLKLNEYTGPGSKGNYFGDINSGHVMIGESEPMREVYDTILKLAKVKYPVLITGGRGTGKEIAAREIHGRYTRKENGNPFVKVNCAAVTGDLLESELFGHMKGSFTGALYNRKGSFRLAHGGILFLDEIGNSSPPMQEKILTAVEYGEITPVGHNSESPIMVNVRVVAATNKEIEKAINDGLFKEDLYDRLARGTIELPPLGERDGDIYLLATYLLGRHNREHGTGKYFSDDAFTFMDTLDLPGNVRELDNLIRRTATMVDGNKITARKLEKYLTRKSVARALFRKSLSDDWDAAIDAIVANAIDSGMSYDGVRDSVGAKLMEETMKKYGVKSQAAKTLGMGRTTFIWRLKRYGLEHLIGEPVRRNGKGTAKGEDPGGEDEPSSDNYRNILRALESLNNKPYFPRELAETECMKSLGMTPGAVTEFAIEYKDILDVKINELDDCTGNSQFASQFAVSDGDKRLAIRISGKHMKENPDLLEEFLREKERELDSAADL